MHFAILIAATISFGPIRTDLTPIANALQVVRSEMQRKNFRIVVTKEAQEDAAHKPESFDKYEQTIVRFSSRQGEYYSRRQNTDSTQLMCTSDAGSFTCYEGNQAWVLSEVLNAKAIKDRISNNTKLAYQNLLSFSGFSLSDLLHDHEYRTGSYPLDRNRVFIWGKIYRANQKNHTDTFCAIVQYSEDRKQAFFEQAESLYCSTDININSTVTSIARFTADSLDYISSQEVRIYYEGVLTNNINPRTKHIRTSHFRTMYRADTSISDNQLLPEYYGFDRRVLKQALETRDQQQSTQLPSSDRYDLLLAIFIPIGLIWLLYLVIRKT